VCEGLHSNSSCLLHLFSEPVTIELMKQTKNQEKKMDIKIRRKRFVRRTNRSMTALLLNSKTFIKDLAKLDLIFNRSIKKKKLTMSNTRSDQLLNESESKNLLNLPHNSAVSSSGRNPPECSLKNDELGLITLSIPLDINKDLDEVHIYRYYYPEFNVNTLSKNNNN
jgi:hypothetical protein